MFEPHLQIAEALGRLSIRLDPKRRNVAHATILGLSTFDIRALPHLLRIVKPSSTMAKEAESGLVKRASFAAGGQEGVRVASALASWCEHHPSPSAQIQELYLSILTVGDESSRRKALQRFGRIATKFRSAMRSKAAELVLGSTDPERPWGVRVASIGTLAEAADGTLWRVWQQHGLRHSPGMALRSSVARPNRRTAHSLRRRRSRR